MVDVAPSNDDRRDATAASSAQAALDAAALVVEDAAHALRRVLAALIGLWPAAAWRAAGCASAPTWLRTYTSLSPNEASRLTRVAEVCARHDDLATAVVSGALPLGRADVLARAVTRERRPLLAPSLDALLRLGTTCVDDDAFHRAVAYWSERCDEHLRPNHGPNHRLYLTPKLFGGGELHGELTPSAFATVAAGLDAWMQGPDPADAPHRRTLAERRADALDDLAHHGLTCREGPEPGCDDDVFAADVFDGVAPDDVHAARHDAVAEGETLTDLESWRRGLRRAMSRPARRRSRRVRRRSGVTVDVICDLRTLAGERDLDDDDLFDGFVLRTGQGWRLACRGAERLRCDAALVATLFDGPTAILDANPSHEQFSAAQRRAIAARDGHCVFPSCRRPPRHCDVHHLHWRSHGGPSTIDNGALCCRFHHRLVHEHGWRLRTDDHGWVATDPYGAEFREPPPRPGPPAA